MQLLVSLVASFNNNILTPGFIFMCSPHIQTIRERISLGRFGEPVAAKALNSLFNRTKKIIDQAVELENGCISHFEVSMLEHWSLLFNI